MEKLGEWKNEATAFCGGVGEGRMRGFA